MQSTIRKSGDVEIIHLVGDFDGGKDCVRSTQQFQEMLDRGVRKIVLDFKFVRWINSSGVGCLIAGKRMADAAGSRMVLCSLNRRSLSVLYTMRLEEVIDCEPDLEAALSAVSGGGPRTMAGNDGAGGIHGASGIHGEQDFRDQI